MGVNYNRPDPDIELCLLQYGGRSQEEFAVLTAGQTIHASDLRHTALSQAVSFERPPTRTEDPSGETPAIGKLGDCELAGPQVEEDPLDDLPTPAIPKTKSTNYDPGEEADTTNANDNPAQHRRGNSNVSSEMNVNAGPGYTRQR